MSTGVPQGDATAGWAYPLQTQPHAGLMLGQAGGSRPSSLAPRGWPLARAAEALEVLAQRHHFPMRSVAVPAPDAAVLESEESFGPWMESVAEWLGLEAEPVDMAHAEVEEALQRAAPAVLRLPGEERILLITGRRRGRIALLGPDLQVTHVPVETLREALCRPLEEPARERVETWLGALGGKARRGARDVLVSQRLRRMRIRGVWVLRLPAGESFWAQVRADRVPSRAVVLVAASLAQMLLGIAGWWMLGRGALSGSLERPWLLAWALLLLTTIPFRVAALWAQGQVAVGLAKLMKRRLLIGALRSDHDQVRRSGSGQLLGRVMESVAVENLALSGGFTSAIALLEFVIGMFVLGAGRGGAAHAAVLGAWGAVAVILGWRSYRANLRWSDARRELTNDLVEHMVGHRTRLAQQPPSRWHDGEDEQLERYFNLSRNMDKTELLVLAMPQAWLVVGLLGFAPGFVAGGSQAELAVGLGGVLLGGQVLARLANGLGQVAAAAVAWKQVAPVFHAAAQPAIVPSPAYSAEREGFDATQRDELLPLLDAADLTFSYPGRPEPAVKGASLRVEVGDRVLLEGPSGSGKTTFAALLSGLKQPSSGLLLLGGLDWHTLGPVGWRRRVAAAPQYNDNHILADTLAFNLLMGRAWPPGPGDVEEAEAILRELGLGELLERMPAGVAQMVGESGWRLSHGERSRVFIARALLQRARLIVLDESFAALDPETMERCMRCVMARAPALIVIAHP